MWSIGIYTGDSPFKLQPAASVTNPVLSSRDVTDITADCVADPFMIRVGSTWYMFFEALNRQIGRGVIACATSSDAFHWSYHQVVLEEPFHLSYPYVFEWGGEYLMVPETLKAGSVRLYKASSFPDSWAFAGELINTTGADPSPFYYAGKWWMFLCPLPYRHDTLDLYMADELEGPWVQHPSSPILTGTRSIARPAGRIMALNGRVIRFAQDCYPVYGTRVRAFELLHLTEDDYIEAAAVDGPILGPAGSGWNGRGMHHLDPHSMSDGCWVACVDGYSS